MPGPHILIVEARYYTDISDELARGAIAVLKEANCSFDRVAVPGAFEIPAAIGFALRAEAKAGHRGYDGYLALGCVIRGETTHYDYVCEESARGLQDLAIEHGIAIGFGVLTVEDEAQAWARAKVDRKNKGGEVARACLRMVELRASFGLV